MNPLPVLSKKSALVPETTYLSSKKKAAEILLAIPHCSNCYSVFSLQFLSPWEMHGGSHMWTMTEAGRHLHRPTCPHCSIQGHLEPAAQFSVQTSFDPLQDGDPVTSLGNQCQCLVTLHKEGHPVILKDEVATIKQQLIRARALIGTLGLSNTVRSLMPL